MLFGHGTPEDAERVAALHTASWQTAYAELMPGAYLNGPLREEHLAKWRARTADPEGRCLLLAEDGDELHGFIHLVAAPDGRIHVDNLHARPGRLGTGIGHRLLRRGFAWAATEHPGRDVYLEVLRGNDRAITFYERQGGIRTAERPLQLTPDLTLDEIEYTWSAAKVHALAEPHGAGGWGLRAPSRGAGNRAGNHDAPAAGQPPTPQRRPPV